MKILVAINIFCCLIFASLNYCVAQPYEEPIKPWQINTDSAVLFQPGIISTRDDEFGGIFADNGKTFYFSKSVLHFYLETICYSKYINGKWSTPEIAPFSGAYRSFDPSISPDGKNILFTSDRPVHGEKKSDYDIWMIEKTSTGWSEPIHLDSPINSQYDEHFASISANGTIYFSSNRPGAVGGDGDADIYRCKLTGGKYSVVEHMNDSMNSPAYVLDCTIAPDESFLLMGYYGRPDGYGSYDIFISKQENGVWSAAKNIGSKVNTSFRDYSPRISPDGQYLFFTSEKDWSINKQNKPYTYKQVTDNFRSILNGSGNIYEIKLSALGIKSPEVNGSDNK